MYNSKRYVLNPISTAAKIAVILISMINWQSVFAQCSSLVTHQSGTVQIGCTQVTVVPQGQTDELTFCGIGPYLAGDSPAGSYLFTFSPPVSGVNLDITGVDNNLSSLNEEVSFEINGNFYPITVPGFPGGCGNNTLIILPNGRLGSPAGTSSWVNQQITENITTLKVENVVTAGFPVGFLFTLRFCEVCCPTNAGVLSGGPFQICLPQAVSFAPATQTNLESNDLLQYVLYADANDPEGSIIAISNTPTFAFSPATMQTGLPYYIAAMAGNNLNGNVDLNDPCLDFSNALTVVWYQRPSVAFAVANQEVCAGGCINVDVTLTGIPPFTLTYTAGNWLTQTQTFSSNTGTIVVCPPTGTPLGTVALSATSLSDAKCLCD